MWAIVPVKRFDQAKRRLASVLNAPQRRGLMLAMAQDVLTALSQAQQLSGVLLVSRAPEADALAQAFGVRQFAESAAANLPQALEEARDHAVSELDATSVFIVPADAPLVSSDEIDQLIQAHRHVTLLPDGEAIGTNGLICTPPAAHPLRLRRQELQSPCRPRPGRRLPAKHSGEFQLRLGHRHPRRPSATAAPSPGGKTAAYLRECGLADDNLGHDRGAR